MANILFVIGVYPNFGGTEKITTVLANEFVKKGYGISIASFKQEIPSLVSELDESIELISLKYPVLNSQNIKILKAYVHEKKIDYIINQWCLPFHVTLLINLARKGTECKLISVLHGLPDRNKRLLTVQNKVETSKVIVAKSLYKFIHRVFLKITSINLRYVYRYSDQYVVLSKSFIASFLKFSNIKNESKIRAISNPITIETAPRYIYSIPSRDNDKENTILYVGRMDYANKRVHRVVEAWEKIFKKHPNWKMVLVGDGPEKEALEAYVESKEILNLKFEGFQKEAPIKFYKKASILLLTSDLEGFGLVVLEGMSFGVVPIVYGSYSAIFDIIENGKSGFITPVPYEVSNTVACIEKLIQDRQLLNEMSNQAREKAMDYEIDIIIDQWHTMFQGLSATI
ncbi:Glycosyltransferase involved in cell wall bisynthesis [Arenibacter palladensis]|uniref:Glycosyltransferase involved in cell wall bisynthesis n=1 Tax=Arenibacter palladensis TaxID=237373 RepID=A0A1M5HNG4_9FLAO|nr:glycosyltransferase [Arenibacter palladensis]SHG17457.1 Glycosyltransferase involved in cell wall bisynthesis [Arenibacter palladensis]